jgi:CRISPR/Cas system CSM-associated protein Csm2 small subunit
MKKNHQIRVLQKEIARVQSEIDLNSAKREECAVNMATWNADNDKNRAIKEELLDNLEEMLGFRLAGQ